MNYNVDSTRADIERHLARIGYATVAISEARQRLVRSLDTYQDILAARGQLAPPETGDLVEQIRQDISRIRAQSAAITKLAVALAETVDALPTPF